MLIKFLKHTPIEWGTNSHSWYNPGDFAVCKIIKSDEKGTWLCLHSDDDLVCIVPPKSFEVVQNVQQWEGDPPPHCHICGEDFSDDAFFLSYGIITCLYCHNDCDFELAKPLLTDSATSRYELDKSEGHWIRTG